MLLIPLSDTLVPGGDTVLAAAFCPEVWKRFVVDLSVMNNTLLQVWAQLGLGDKPEIWHLNVFPNFYKQYVSRYFSICLSN